MARRFAQRRVASAAAPAAPFCGVRPISSQRCTTRCATRLAFIASAASRSANSVRQNAPRGPQFTAMTGPTTVIMSAGPQLLPPTAPGELAIVARVDDGDATGDWPAGGALYDGHPWESAAPLHLPVHCDAGGACTATIPSGAYRLTTRSDIATPPRGGARLGLPDAGDVRPDARQRRRAARPRRRRQPVRRHEVVGPRAARAAGDAPPRLLAAARQPAAPRAIVDGLAARRVRGGRAVAPVHVHARGHRQGDRGGRRRRRPRHAQHGRRRPHRGRRRRPAGRRDDAAAVHARGDGGRHDARGRRESRAPPPPRPDGPEPARRQRAVHRRVPPRDSQPADRGDRPRPRRRPRLRRRRRELRAGRARAGRDRRHRRRAAGRVRAAGGGGADGRRRSVRGELPPRDSGEYGGRAGERVDGVAHDRQGRQAVRRAPR